MIRVGSHDWRTFATAAVAALTLLAACGPAEEAAADTQIAAPGSAAGEVLEPSAIAVDPANGNLYVADSGNRRIDVFGSGGEFLRAFGWGVVAAGPHNNPKNQVEEVEVAATGGSFTLLFIQNGTETIGPIKQETAALPFNASAPTVQGALEALAPLSPGDVDVSGPAGGPWTIEFKGVFADMALHELEAGPASHLTGGLGKLAIDTSQLGAAPEVCEPTGGDVCRPGQRGTEGGQLNPTSVAVDPVSHDVYVFDGLESSSHNEAPNNRVQRFTSAGAFLYMLGGGVDLDTGEDVCTAASGHECGRGQKGSGAGEFDAARSSVAVDPSGVLYVNDGGRVQKFDAAGAPLGQVALPGVWSDFLAVDSSGDLYAGTNGEINEYNSAGAPIESFPLSNVGAIAVDGSDGLYVSNLSSGKFGISIFDSSGALTKVFYSTSGLLSNQGSQAKAVARHASQVFAIEEGSIRSLTIPPAGPVVHPHPDSISVSQIGNVKATFRSEVNPEGKPTTFHFELVDDASFQAEGWSSSAVKASPESPSIGTDFTLHPAVQQVLELTPETLYHVRAVAANADAPAGNPGPEKTFETEPPVAIGQTWASDVDSGTATLHGEVNPLGIAATGYFEYVDDVAYQGSEFATATKVPAGTPLDFGAGEDFVEGSAEASGLVAGTTYHFRLVAMDRCKPAEPSVVCRFESPPGTFRAFAVQAPTGPCPNEGFRDGAAGFLADCRAYELVSPVEKNGSNIEVVTNLTGYPAALDQAAPDGNRITYSAYRAFSQPESAPYSVQYVAERTGDGWTTEPISPPREGPSLFNSAGLEYQFKAFTPDLCLTWALQDTALRLAPEAVPGYPGLYRRENCGPGAGGYTALTTVGPAGGLEPRLFFPELQGFSADGSRAFFSVPAKLAPGVPEGVAQVYEATSTGLNPVCVLPNTLVASGSCSLGTGSGFGVERSSRVAGAVSDDGSVAYWSEAAEVPAKIYVRVNGLETFQVSAQAAQFWSASADGSRAVYSVAGNLFEFDLGTKSSTLIAEGVTGVVGTSDDAGCLYFVSTKKLATEATAGQPNLYVSDGGAIRFIGTLLDADLLANRPSPIADRPVLHTSRVTPDGGRVVFMSKASLTGYDNTDLVSGKPDSEVYLYDATANGGSGELRCISCNPGGGRPAGRAWDIAKIVGGSAAAWIPGWSTQLYAPRVIADDGSRVFFNSYDALTGRDENGVQDVYQWEALGSGDCEEASQYFVPAAKGCVSLISSGESSEGSALVDSSASGGDVFFKTYSSLASQDPGLLDVYDARVEGGFAAPAQPAPECEGEGCLPQPPAPPTHPTPESSTFVGPGDRVEAPRKRKGCPKGRRKAKRRGKVVCSKNGAGRRKAARHGRSGK